MRIEDKINYEDILIEEKLINKNIFLLISPNASHLNKFLLKIFALYNKKYSKFNLLISGGRTFNKFLLLLGKKKFKEKIMNIYLTDERMVKRKSNNSNERKILKYLGIYNKNKKNIRFFSLLENPNFNLNMIANKYPSPAKINLCLLGVGADGHIASIYVKSKKIVKHKNLLICKNKYEYFNRISLSLDYLARIPVIIILIQDLKKTKILDECMKLRKESTLPVIKLLHKSKGIVYVLTSKYYMNKL